MENNTKITLAFMISLLSLVASIGSPLLQNYSKTEIISMNETKLYELYSSLIINTSSNISELTGYYVCNVTGNISKFARVSSTGVTGYPFIESNSGRMYCGSDNNRGVWQTITEFSENLGINPYDYIIEKSKEEENIATKEDVTNPMIYTSKSKCNIQEALDKFKDVDEWACSPYPVCCQPIEVKK